MNPRPSVHTFCTRQLSTRSDLAFLVSEVCPRRSASRAHSHCTAPRVSACAPLAVLHPTLRCDRARLYVPPTSASGGSAAAAAAVCGADREDQAGIQCANCIETISRSALTSPTPEQWVEPSGVEKRAEGECTCSLHYAATIASHRIHPPISSTPLSP